MPRFKRTRFKVDETDSESGGSPTIGKRSNKRNKLTENAPATDCPPPSSPQKLAVYIVAAKLESNRIEELSNLVEESTEYSLARNSEEADVIVTGTGVRERLERSVPVAIIVSYHLPSPSHKSTAVTVIQGSETHTQTRVAGKVDRGG
jgi:hypothetical protein